MEGSKVRGWESQDKTPDGTPDSTLFLFTFRFMSEPNDLGSFDSWKARWDFLDNCDGGTEHWFIRGLAAMKAQRSIFTEVLTVPRC